MLQCTEFAGPCRHRFSKNIEIGGTAFENNILREILMPETLFQKIPNYGILDIK